MSTLSIVTTLYQSEAHLPEFYLRATAAAQGWPGDYEIILVNDGSVDRGLELAKELAEKDDNIVVVDLSRNFGHHKAMMTGLSYAVGDYIFLIDSDLEESPEWLSLFTDIMQKRDCDVVYGVQNSRKGNVIERLTGYLFYSLFNALSGVRIPRNLVTTRLMTRRYVDALLLHQERELMIAGIWILTGYEQCPLTVQKLSSSQTTYTLAAKMRLLVNGVVSLSNAPLVGVFYLGVTIFLLASVYLLYLVYNWTFAPTPPAGWTSVMASIWLIGGLLISVIGVVGLYISKIYSETKRRPNTIVRQIYSSRPERNVLEDHSLGQY